MTAEFGVAALLLEFLLGFGLALLLSRIVRGEGVIRVLILLPTMVTPTVAGMNFRMMLNFDSRGDRLPAAAASVCRFGLGTSDIFRQTALASLVLTDVWRSTPSSLSLC